jgi:hypothetical protein
MISKYQFLKNYNIIRKFVIYLLIIYHKNPQNHLFKLIQKEYKKKNKKLYFVLILYIMNNYNFVNLNIIKNIIKNKGLDKYIKQIGYSNNKDSKYYVILNNNKIVNFGSKYY